MGISPIFNVSDLYPYKEDGVETNDLDRSIEQIVDWQGQIPSVQRLEMEQILDTRVLKKTRGKEYYEYLVKWKDHPPAYATWVTIALIQKSGRTIEQLMNKSP